MSSAVTRDPSFTSPGKFNWIADIGQQLLVYIATLLVLALLVVLAAADVLRGDVGSDDPVPAEFVLLFWGGIMGCYPV
ncbi:hypothetical protein DYI20_09470 [Auritidibacter ignavus]|uniref:hypothetical protein n=1 Tax=Auritidibacter TaxID=1160973 RepID=UPI000D736838|nr:MULTISPECIES: hypothetical protein [Auritidibacter]AXR73095.1 hypothetical protein DCC27_000865 [Auritidibacter sp. NML130574]NIH71532.1 hypothetical protein [Auritidibacter ignavus]PXA81849.1 hypothetical protein DCC25_00195 [Auritidibacter sp. NML120636]RMX22522.1 hypothetical protein DYI20_09470 [Auritidibacter ignavus]WGH86245.1 hypothetical protein QDX24_11990 [Auritidibacter ignavus]